MKIVGVDPSIVKGQACSFWEDEFCTGWVKVDSIVAWHNLLMQFSPDLVLIEDQYLANNYKTSKGLSVQIGKMIGIAELLDIEYEIVNVATWQSKVGLVNVGKGLTPYHRRKLKKLRLIEEANKVYQGVDDDDIASAILIPYAMYHV